MGNNGTVQAVLTVAVTNALGKIRNLITVNLVAETLFCLLRLAPHNSVTF